MAQECLIRLRMDFLARRRVQVTREQDLLQRKGSATLAELAQLAQDCVELDRERNKLKSLLRETLEEGEASSRSQPRDPVETDGTASTV